MNQGNRSCSNGQREWVKKMKMSLKDIDERAHFRGPASKEQMMAIERMERLGFGLLAVYAWNPTRVLEDARVAEAYIEAMCAVADLSFQMEEKA